MKVPYQIRRTDNIRPTRALLVPTHDVATLLNLCVQLGLESPRIFSVADGFLLRVDGPVTVPIAGTIRLGELVANLLLPVDAELMPALLSDEAQALVRKRGLIMLPGGRVLEFGLDQKILLSALVKIDGLRRNAWTALPSPPVLAERITEITYHRPDDVPDLIIETGGEGIGEEEPRPDDASLPKKMFGSAAMGLGKGLNWLGKILHVGPLAKLGGALMAGGLAMVPRFSEKIMGKQEACLRDLLEDFRKGNIEKALRRALPLGNSGARTASPHQGTQLPTHNLRYSLGDFLGRWGPASLWYAPDQIYFELRREYLKQADAAVRRGDYRRAAFIYAKLLGDFALAAAVLAQGGLHHDAAIIYLKRLNDHLAAAREFAAAGEIDEALNLYRQKQQHVQAGDLLHRMGEIDQAVAEYKEAADLIVANGQGYCQAGDLMLSKAERPDLAMAYFVAGWNARPGASAVLCARRLAQEYAQSVDTISLQRLVREANDFFQTPGNETLTAEFCNDVARLAERPALAPIRESLRDGCLLALAHKLRQNWDTRDRLAGQLFGAGELWGAPLVSDAHRAAQTQQSPWTAMTDATTVLIPARIPVVRSTCQASGSGIVFLGFESGEVFCFTPSTGEAQQLLPAQTGPVHGLATDELGTTVAILSGDQPYQISVYQRANFWHIVESRALDGVKPYWLCPILARTHDLMATLFDGDRGELGFFRMPRFLREGCLVPEIYWPLTCIPLMLRDSAIVKNPGSIRSATYLLFDGRELCFIAHDEHRLDSMQLIPCGIPHPLDQSSLDFAPLTWLSTGTNRLEVAGVGAEGVVSWLEIEFEQGRLTNSTVRSAPGPFLAAALVRRGLIAGVASNAIVWLRAGASGIKEQVRQRLSVPDVVACFSHAETKELLIVGGNGSITRVCYPV